MNWVFSLLSTGALLFATLPVTAPQTNSYGLQSYGFGSGGTAGSSTATYQLEGISGEISGAPSTSPGSTSNSKTGYIVDQQASVPRLLSADNGSGVYYNKLHFVIDNRPDGATATNTFPSDTKFLIAVSTTSGIDGNNNFTGTTYYLHTDGTLSTTLSLSDYQTYSSFGGAGGSFIIGLDQNTPYYIHVKATHGTNTTQGSGPYTESAYGPTTTQATAAASLTFSLNTNTLNLGTISTTTPTSGTITTNFSTNGASGGNVYIKGLNGGLKSTSTTYKIASTSTDLSVATEGFGARNSSISQTTGSYSVVAPYNGASNNVGVVDATNRSLYTATAPLTGGVGILAVLAKAATTDVAASDYQEILTFIAAANF